METTLEYGFDSVTILMPLGRTVLLNMEGKPVNYNYPEKAGGSLLLQ